LLQDQVTEKKGERKALHSEKSEEGSLREKKTLKTSPDGTQRETGRLRKPFERRRLAREIHQDRDVRRTINTRGASLGGEKTLRTKQKGEDRYNNWRKKKGKRREDHLPNVQAEILYRRVDGGMTLG